MSESNLEDATQALGLSDYWKPPPPTCRSSFLVPLRIVDENGNDITGTRLGEPLFLRIELDGDSIFDIFARNLVSKKN